MAARDVVAKFGGQSALAAIIGKGQSTVAYWVKTGTIPARWQVKLLKLARERGISLEVREFIDEVVGPNPKPISNIVAVLPSGLAAPKQQAQLNLGIEKQIEIDGVSFRRVGGAVLRDSRWI